MERVENILGKGENAGYQGLCAKELKEYYLQVICTITFTFKDSSTIHQTPIFWPRSNSKHIANNQFNVFDSLKNIVGKGKKCWLLAFSPFSTSFSKGLCFRVVYIHDCVLKSEIKNCTKFAYQTFSTLSITAFNPLPDNKILDWSKLKQSADDNFEFDVNSRKFSKLVENTVGKGEIARYEQFFLFQQYFQKACFSGV